MLGRTRRFGDADLRNPENFRGTHWDAVAARRQPRPSGRGAEAKAGGAAPKGGGALMTEDDVIHASAVETFGGALSGDDAESLLSFLTVPALRIPLLLRFFATGGRLTALTNQSLQRVLWAAVFSPGGWPAPSLPAVEMAPCRPVADPRHHLGVKSLHQQRCLAFRSATFPAVASRPVSPQGVCCSG